MKKVNFVYSRGTLTKGTADDLFENEHNAAQICVVFESGMSFEDDCSFVFQFHTPDCRRLRYIADYDSNTKTVSASLANDVMCAGKVRFDLEMTVSDNNGGIVSVTHLISSDFTVKPAICDGEDSTGEYTDALRLFEQKYIKSRKELDLLIDSVINRVLPSAMTRIDDAVEYLRDQTDLTLQMTEQACANVRTELASDIRRIIEENLTDIDRLSVSVGSVEMIESDQEPSVYNSGTGQDVILNFRLPRPEITVNGKTPVNGNIDITCNDIALPSSRILSRELNCELPRGTVVGERGGYLISLKGATAYNGEITAARPVLIIRKKNGELRQRIVLPSLHKWDSATIYKPGTALVSNEEQGLTVYRQTNTVDLARMGGWLKRRVGDYTEFYTTHIYFSGFDSKTQIPNVYSPHLEISTPAKLRPNDGEWLITVNDEHYLSLMYGGNFNTTINGFRDAMNEIGPDIVYRAKTATPSYLASVLLDIRPEDEIELVSEANTGETTGDITFAEIPISDSEDVTSTASVKEELYVTDTLSVHVPCNALDEYILSDIKRDLICRSENIMPPMVNRNGILKTPNAIPILPGHKYFLRFFGADDADINITLSQYKRDKTLISETTLKDYYFISDPNAAFADITLTDSPVSDPGKLEGMMSDNIINTYSPHRIRHMCAFDNNGRIGYRLALLKGGELLAADGEALNIRINCSPKRKVHTLSEPCKSGDFTPYGVCEDPLCRVRISVAQEAENDLCGELHILHGGNQYDPYISSSAVSENEGLTLVEKRANGIIRAYNTAADCLVIRDNDPTILHKKTQYTLIVRVVKSSECGAGNVSAVDGNGEQLKVVKMGNVTNGYRYTVTTADSNEVYFTFSFDEDTTKIKSIDYRVSINAGQMCFDYTPHESPYVLPIKNIGAGECFDATLKIPITRGGLVYFKPISGEVQELGVSVETEFKFIASDIMSDAASVYSRNTDSDGNTLHGMRQYIVRGYRNTPNSRFLNYNSSSGVSKLSVDTTYIGLSGGAQAGDIITVYGR